jgi:hypothetical protein
MLEAHRDIDEDYCRKNQVPVALGSDEKFGIQRCPSFGHVLYVHVKDHGATQCLAPTAVWQEEGGFQTGPPRNLEKLFVVPAKSNRFLRFRGDCIHAVCHPPLAFLDTAATKKETSTIPKEIDQHCRRAVLLFNTWEEPPLHPPVGESMVSRDTKNVVLSQPCRSKRWNQWEEHQIVYDGGDLQSTRKQTRLSVPLLGGTSRRGCRQESLDSMVDEQKAITAFTSRDAVHCLNLLPCSSKNA